MKFNTLLILAIFLAALTTCKKEGSSIIDSHIIELDKVSVLKNGSIWDVPFSTQFSHSDSAFLIKGIIMNYNNGVRQTFRIDDIPCKAGLYSYEFWPNTAALYPNQIPQVAFVMMYDGDQPIGDFLLDTLRNDHFIEVLSYDTLSNIVEGRFQVFLKKRESGGWQPSGISVPDSIAMTDGKFRLEVKN